MASSVLITTCGGDLQHLGRIRQARLGRRTVAARVDAESVLVRQGQVESTGKGGSQRSWQGRPGRHEDHVHMVYDLG